MKIKEIIKEASFARHSMRPTGYDDMSDPKYGDPDIGEYDDGEDDFEPLETDASDSAEQALVDAVRDLIGQGASEVETTVLTNKVVEATHEPFLPADLVALFKQSETLQRYIDKVDPNKVKFSADILTATSDKKSSGGSGRGADQRATTLRTMASRAANRRA